MEKSLFEEIILRKKKEIEQKKKKISIGELAKKAMSLTLKNQYKNQIFYKRIKVPLVGDISIIGEIKLKSPTSGILSYECNVEEIAKSYQSGYCDALSIVVDSRYFGGNPTYISKVKNAVSLPVLFKDFVLDTYQIYEALSVGADAILLLARLDKYYDQDFDEILEIGNLLPIVEVGSEDELELDIVKNAKVIGVNARDLDTFEVDVKKACRIIEKIPKDKLIIGFSGVNSRREVEMYKKAGASAVLVGTSLMNQKNPYELLRELKGLPKI